MGNSMNNPVFTMARSKVFKTIGDSKLALKSIPAEAIVS
jgi:hypothetical protein